jgi:hypothetical protein
MGSKGINRISAASQPPIPRKPILAEGEAKKIRLVGESDRAARVGVSSST